MTCLLLIVAVSLFVAIQCHPKGGPSFAIPELSCFQQYGALYTGHFAIVDENSCIYTTVAVDVTCWFGAYPDRRLVQLPDYAGPTPNVLLPKAKPEGSFFLPGVSTLSDKEKAEWDAQKAKEKKCGHMLRGTFTARLTRIKAHSTTCFLEKEYTSGCSGLFSIGETFGADVEKVPCGNHLPFRHTI